MGPNIRHIRTYSYEYLLVGLSSHRFVQVTENVGNETLMCDSHCSVCAGYLDDIIEPRQTRRRLCADLELLSTKKQSNPLKKHSNIPL